MRIRSILAAALLFCWPAFNEALADTSPPQSGDDKN
jgi:hypothetical protein